MQIEYEVQNTVQIAVISEQLKSDRVAADVFREQLREELSEIKQLVTATNGRVRSLEAWRTFLTGGFVALSLPAAAKIVEILH